MKKVALGFSLLIAMVGGDSFAEKIMSAPQSQVTATNLISDQKESIIFGKAKRATVLLFLSSACPCTNGAIGEIRELAKKYSDMGFDFYGINLDYQASAQSLKKYYAVAKLGFPILRDSQLEIAKSFGVELMAESAVIGADLSILYRGGIKTEKDEMILFDALDAISKGKEPAQKIGDGMGCFLLYPSRKANERPQLTR